jgi:hypothetical protein
LTSIGFGRTCSSCAVGEPVDFDLKGLGGRLLRTDAPDGWIKKFERRQGKVWVVSFILSSLGDRRERATDSPEEGKDARTGERSSTRARQTFASRHSCSLLLFSVAPPIGMAQVFGGGDAIPDNMLQLLDLGEPSYLRSRPDGVIADTNRENASSAGHQRNLADIG